MPPERKEDERNMYCVQSKTFQQLLDHVRRWRSALGPMAHNANVCQFVTPAAVVPGDNIRFYALGTPGDQRDHTILFVDVPSKLDEHHEREESMDAVTEDRKSLRNVLHWNPLLRVSQDVSMFRGLISKEEELLRERMRCMTHGITSYDYEPVSGTFLFSASAHLYRCADDQRSEWVSPTPIDVPLNLMGAPLDPKICPNNPQLVACVGRNDIYVHFGQMARQATFAHESDDETGMKLAGVSSFIIQEEFDRYTGYWWRPTAGKNETYYLLYEETDENPVLELSINVPATRVEHVEHMRYPRAGTDNVTWALKMLRIHLFESGDANLETTKDAKIDEMHCLDMRHLFPWAEYLTRAGWLPNGKGIWFQLMSRLQDRLLLACAPMSIFENGPAVDFSSNLESMTASQSESMEDLTSSSQVQDVGSNVPVVGPVLRDTAGITVLYDEHTPDTWINYHDALKFLPSSDEDNGEVEFLWLSGKTGFYHLYHVTSSWQSSQNSNSTTSPSTPTAQKQVQLTSGEWDVRRNCVPHVDEARKLVFFMALKDTPLQQHVYVTSYGHPGAVRLLTEADYSYGGARDGRPFCVSADGSFMITSRSSVSEVGECVVFALDYHSEDQNDHLPRSRLLYVVNKNPGIPRSISNDPAQNTWEMCDVPELYAFDSQRTGFRHYAYLFKPRHLQSGYKYPTILYVYGGPEVQLVKNVWMGSYGFHKYTSLGYAVVMIDGRGSTNRGVQFEQALKHRLGTLEVEDQVEGLNEVARLSGMIDMDRVAVLGWSYGGYLSLLCLAQRPEIFKVAISGAPVTVWSLYDTAYTERYMGLPQTNREAYISSSVLSQIDRFPSESGRLLLLHGLMDENVHFRHTSMLISALIRAGKPYQLQIFPAERHAVRNVEVNEHMDATVLDFLQRNL